MRALGLDIGEARIGVAVSNAEGTVASPLAVLDARELARDMRPLRRIVDDYEADVLVAGLPLTLSGEEGPQALAVRSVAERLAEAAGIPVEYWDERLSSAEASRVMRAAGVSEREQRGTLDRVAAAIVLQGWLDQRRGRAQEDE